MGRGRCGPIQDQLRQLVSSKIRAAQTQLGDLMTVASELQTAAAALERHRPVGACDDQCGCVNDPTTADETAITIQAVTLSAKPQPAGQPAIACTLSAGSIHGRVEDWQHLRRHVVRREALDGGVRNEFDADLPTSELMRLVAAEQDCCQFFQFAITVDIRGVALEVRAPADALPIVTSMFGDPS